MWPIVRFLASCIFAHIVVFIACCPLLIVILIRFRLPTHAQPVVRRLVICYFAYVVLTLVSLHQFHVQTRLPYQTGRHISGGRPGRLIQANELVELTAVVDEKPFVQWQFKES